MSCFGRRGFKGLDSRQRTLVVFSSLAWHMPKQTQSEVFDSFTNRHFASHISCSDEMRQQGLRRLP